jgi:hypothetical protein
VVLWVLLAAPSPGLAQEARLSTGQIIYVPAYAYVHISGKVKAFPLTTTLLFHNTSLDTEVTVSAIKYYDGKGNLVEEYAPSPVRLGPLAALDVPVKKPVMNQGSGACFVVTWTSSKPISPPLAESVMIGATGQQGISYRSTGQVIKELK